MQFYAQSPALRARQIAADAGMLAWVVLWIMIAKTVHGTAVALAGPGRAVEDLGASVAGNMGSAADVADGVPVVGEQLAMPFDALAAAGGSVSGAGRAAEDAVGTLAMVLALVFVVLPVGWLLLHRVPARLTYAREAGAAQRLLSGTPQLDVLAARALASAPLARLVELPVGTVAAWRAGEPAAVQALAELELRRLGLRVPAGAVSRPDG